MFSRRSRMVYISVLQHTITHTTYFKCYVCICKIRRQGYIKIKFLKKKKGRVPEGKANHLLFPFSSPPPLSFKKKSKRHQRVIVKGVLVSPCVAFIFGSPRICISNERYKRFIFVVSPLPVWKLAFASSSFVLLRLQGDDPTLLFFFYYIVPHCSKLASIFFFCFSNWNKTFNVAIESASNNRQGPCHDPQGSSGWI